MASILPDMLSSDRVRDLPKIDLYDIQCSICHNILWKPVACQSCETPFCSMCIDTWLISNPNKCPMRCQNFIQRSCPRFLAQQLAKMQIACIYQSSGCNEIVQYDALETHEMQCDYQPQLCFNCWLEILKNKWTEHESYCSMPTKENTVSLDGPSISTNARWIQNGITIAGGNGQGNELNQLNSPCGIYVDDDQTVYIADCLNHRIVEWKSGAICGQVVAGGNGQGDESYQLNKPTDVVIDKETDHFIISDHGNRRVVLWSRQNGKNGKIIISNFDCSGLAIDNNRYLYVSDYIKDEVRRWRVGNTHGTLVAGGNGKGDRLNQLRRPTHIFIDANNSVYVADEENHRVMKWTKDASEGIIVAGGNGEGNSLAQLSRPYEVIVDQFGTVYVADRRNARVMRWTNEFAQGSIVVGTSEHEGQINPLKAPVSLSFDKQGNLYVVDFYDHRVQKFTIDLISNF